MAVAAVDVEERTLVRCGGCGSILAAQVAGLSVVRRKGFEWIGRVYSMKCAGCGLIWRPISEEPQRGE